MNLEFGNIVKIFLKDQVVGISDGSVIPKEDEHPIVIHAADFDINPEVNDSKSSLLTTTAVTLYVDKLKPDDALVLKKKRSVLVQTCKSDGSNTTIGTIEYPAQITLSKALNRDILKVDHKMPSHLS